MSNKLLHGDFFDRFQQLLWPVKNELEIHNFLPESIIFLLKVL